LLKKLTTSGNDFCPPLIMLSGRPFPVFVLIVLLKGDELSLPSAAIDRCMLYLYMSRLFIEILWAEAFIKV